MMGSVADLTAEPYDVHGIDSRAGYWRVQLTVAGDEILTAWVADEVVGLL